MFDYALLDTHSFIWFISGDERLSWRARSLIEAPESSMFVSIASLWEIAISGVLAVEVRHLAELVQLPQHHRDPYDRLIVVQARAEGLPVISVDPALDTYGVQRLW